MNPPRLKVAVEYMLKENPKVFGVEVRNSDIALMLAIWNRWYNVGLEQTSTIHVRRLFDLPRDDNVKRWRAKFQNEFNQYLPTDWDVAKKRGIQREIWEDALGYSRDPAVVRQQKQMIAETTPPKFPDEEPEQPGLFTKGEVPEKPPKRYY